MRRVLIFIVFVILSSGVAHAAKDKPQKYADLEKYYPLKQGNILIYCLFDKDTPSEVNTTTDCGLNKYGGKGCVMENVVMDSIKTESTHEIRGNTLAIAGRGERGPILASFLA